MQAELFATCFQSKGYERIAGGCYGSVYATADSEWVVKVAHNDGTRTYLEWCQLKTARGERMRGMPELDFVVPRGFTCEYIVAMKRYIPLGTRLQDEYGFTLIYNVHHDDKCPQYLKDLVAAFEHDCPAVSVNDFHFQNVMQDSRSGDFILTDPSSSSYRPVGSTYHGWGDPVEEEFQLV